MSAETGGRQQQGDVKERRASRGDESPDWEQGVQKDQEVARKKGVRKEGEERPVRMRREPQSLAVAVGGCAERERGKRCAVWIIVCLSSGLV